MRKTLKRVVSTALAGLMVASVATVAVSANDGQKTLVTVDYALTNHFEPLLGTEIETTEYYFYMPDSWKNQYNDYYDGSDPNSYSAGVYWWEGVALPADYPDNTNDWPGYAVTDQDPNCPNVYKTIVPTVVPMIVWNNSVNGGTDNTLDVYTAAIQSDNASVAGYGVNSDNYGFYPNGLESMAGMIYVCNPDDITYSAASQKMSYKGEWFYYYGNGEYGYAPTKEEAGDNVWSDGVFPPTKLTASVLTVDTGVSGDFSFTTNKGNTTATVTDETIATATADGTGKITVTGVKAGETTVVLESYNVATKETDTITLPVTVVDPSFDPTSITLNAGDQDYVYGFGIGENAVIKSSNSKVATYDPATFTVNAKKSGKATITATQGDVTISFKVTVKAPKLNKTSQKLAAGKTYKLKVSNTGYTPTFTSSNSKIASVNKKTGVVTALKKGTVTITAKVGSEKVKCTIKVTSSPKLAKKSITVKKNQKKTVKITGAASKPTVTKCKVAKITPSKTKLTIKGSKKGSQKVTVKVNGVKLTLKVVVK